MSLAISFLFDSLSVEEKGKMQLKRWESPRRQDRNSKGQGGAARMRS